MSVECRHTPRLGASAWIPWIHSLYCDAADCDAERNSHQFSVSELLEHGFSNSAQQVREKGGDEKTLPYMCQDSSVALGELWPSLPSRGATQPGGTPTARGGNQGWLFGNAATQALPERCLSV